jgi:hypothetical protein
MNVLKPKRGPVIDIRRCDLDIGHFKVLQVANKEAVARGRSEPVQIWIRFFDFGHLDGLPIREWPRRIPGSF